MRTFYRWFDIFLNILLVCPVILFFIMPYLAQHSTSYNASFERIDMYLSVLLFISIVTSVLYLLLGIILFLINSKKKNNNKIIIARELVLKGLIRFAIPYILLHIGLAFGFYGVL